jgi:hypothetical protein
MGYHKLGMQAIGIVHVSKHDGAEREREIFKKKKERAMCNHTCMNMCILSVYVYVIDGLP